MTSPQKFSKKIAGDRGLIKMIVVIVIALLILSYVGFNLRNLINSPTTKDNFSVVIGVISDVWNHYLKGPFFYVWNNFFIPHVWIPISSSWK